MFKKENVLIIGASNNPERYSFKALKMLLEGGHKPFAIGANEFIVEGVNIQKGMIQFDEKIDTVTIYINPLLQKEYYNYIINLKPKRVIFNPGSENPEFEQLLLKNEIKIENACTLVLLATDQF